MRSVINLNVSRVLDELVRRILHKWLTARVLELRFHRRWHPNLLADKALIVQYADNFVVRFQSKGDAERFLENLRKRLAGFGLDLHPRKTQLVEFARFAAANRQDRG